jgi:hypothetical protein
MHHMCETWSQHTWCLCSRPGFGSLKPGCDSISTMYLLLLAILSHETFVADVGEEKAFVDGDVGGVLVGGVGGALVGVTFPPHVCLAVGLRGGYASAKQNFHPHNTKNYCGYRSWNYH